MLPSASRYNGLFPNPLLWFLAVEAPMTLEVLSTAQQLKHCCSSSEAGRDDAAVLLLQCWFEHANLK